MLVCAEQDDVQVTLEHEGEGLWGNYDGNNPDDLPLLRFYCYVKGELRQEYLKYAPYELSDRSPIDNSAEWVSLSDGSYCTQLPATLAPEIQQQAAQKLLDLLYDPITSLSIKKEAEAASWITTRWLNQEV